MTQTSLFDLPASRPRKRGQVTRTAVEAGRAVNRDARAQDAIDVIDDALLATDDYLTSAELCRRLFGSHADMSELLYVRRGLSDALRKGFVEHAGERTCAVSGRTCVTWKLPTR